MINISIICVGKLNSSYYADGVADYGKRLGGFCSFNIVEISEEIIYDKNPGAALIEGALKKEGERILSAVPKGAKTVSLCIEGKAASSEELAENLSAWANSGISSLAFIIGSSHGLHETVVKNSFCKLSLSRMTLPHQMARLFLCEQLYRAFMINSGGKYHK